MKAVLSIAILALLNNVSATKLNLISRQKQTNQLQNQSHHKIDDEAKAWRNFFQKSGQEAVQLQAQQNAYYDKLDQQAEDDQSFEFVQLKNKQESHYDHERDTDDIPDDLQPIGFYAQDKEIMQEKAKLDALDKQQQPGQFTANKQKDAHDADTEDVPEQPEPLDVYNKPNWFVQTNFNHENDTDDVPSDPFIDTNLNYVEPPSDAFIQMKVKAKFDHENDTDDMPEGQNPVGFVQLKHQSRKHKHAPKSRSMVQLNDDQKPHENDTDDIGYENRAVNAYESYDIHHTKEWNEKVNLQAAQLENQMKDEEEVEQTKKDNQREAEQEKEEARNQQALAQHQAQERRKYEEAMADGHQHLGQVDSKIYGFFENEINPGANSKLYQHHSRYWEEKVDQQASALESELNEDDASVEEPAGHKTIELADVYDKMAVQTGYEHHSKFWKDQVALAEQKLEKEMKADDEAEDFKKIHHDGQIFAQGMTPADTYVHHVNPSVNFGEIYEGVDLVQLSDHENDEDDIVPELNEAVKAPMHLAKKEPFKKDFAGEEFEETYDD